MTGSARCLLCFYLVSHTLVLATSLLELATTKSWPRTKETGPGLTVWAVVMCSGLIAWISSILFS